MAPTSNALRFVIIGGGPAGTQAATVAARLGADVTLIERDIIGGAAHLWDCIPSKAMIATGAAFGEFGVAGTEGTGLRDGADGGVTGAPELELELGDLGGEIGQGLGEIALGGLGGGCAGRRWSRSHGCQPRWWCGEPSSPDGPGSALVRPTAVPH